MLQVVLAVVIAVVVAAVVFLIATRVLPPGEQVAPPLRDEAPWDLPDGEALTPGDVDGLRLPVALRGYRFAETDLLLDRLAYELRERDEQIARLRREAAPAEPAVAPVVPPTDEPAAEA